MAHYLYCVLPGGAPEPDATGIDGAAVRALRGAGVAAWVSDVSGTPRPDLGRIRAHDDVIRVAMDTGATPIPIRWGQVLATEADVIAHLESRDYAADLERVAGAVEFGLRIVDPEAAADDVPAAATRTEAKGSGATYMRLLAERMHALERTRARALEAARAVDDALADLVRDRRIEPSDRPPGATVAHLVQAISEDEYVERARGLSNAHPPLHIVVTGPWPPYSFVA